MTSDVEDNAGLTDEVVQGTKAMPSVVAARNEGEDRKVREAIDTLISADTEVIFLHYLALLPCLEKLGNDFLSFKRPSMLKDDYDHAVSILNTVVGNFQIEVRNLQRYLTPELALPQPIEYRRPREEALAYAEKCNPFRQDTMGTPQEQEQIMQRLQASSNMSVRVPQTLAQSSPPADAASQPKTQERRANDPPLMSLQANSKKVRKSGPRTMQYPEPSKRRKVDSGLIPSDIPADSTGQTHRRAASLPENMMTRLAAGHVMGLPYSHSHIPSAAQTPLEVKHFGQFRAQENNPLSSNIASQYTLATGYTPIMGYAPFSGGVPGERLTDATSTHANSLASFRAGSDLEAMISELSPNNEGSSADMAAFGEQGGGPNVMFDHSSWQGASGGGTENS